MDSTCLEDTKKMPLEPGRALAARYISDTVASISDFLDD